jgi:PleD family two-component response regulator
MGTSRILIVEDNPDIGSMLRLYFEKQGFEVLLATRGGDALILTRATMPNLLILDIMLPDMNGYDVCRSLRGSSRTAHIPILFLTQKNERGDRIAGLELGADDYITKPVDLEELHLRVQNTIQRTERESLTDPHTGLPASRLIENRLQECLSRKGWALLDCRLLHFDEYRAAYGSPTADDILRFTAVIILEVVDQAGTPNDFIGYSGGDSFILLTEESRAGALEARLKTWFAQDIPEKYSYLDRQRGFMLLRNTAGVENHVPLMELSVTTLRSSEHNFSDVRQITEKTAALRMQHG